MGLIYSFFNYFLTLLKIVTLKIKYPSAHFEQGIMVKGPLKNLKIGRNVNIQSSSILHLGGKAWCNDAGGIEIGDGGTISPNCVLYGCGNGGIRIGRNFDCGPFAGIYSSRTNYENKGEHIFKPVKIGDNVILFSHVVISPGVTIGDGAVVAAGSVVVNDVPPNTLVGGAPAKIIKNLID